MLDLALILLVEDREDDVTLIQTAFRRGRVPNPVQVVRDGTEAVAYLKGEGKYANRDEFPVPALILLDLNMPRMDGFEVLESLAATDSVENVALFVLVICRNNHSDGLPHRFLGRVSEYPLRGPIPRGNQSVQIFTDDGIV